MEVTRLPREQLLPQSRPRPLASHRRYTSTRALRGSAWHIGEIRYTFPCLPGVVGIPDFSFLHETCLRANIQLEFWCKGGAAFRTNLLRP